VSKQQEIVMKDENEAGRAAMPEPEISQEAARAMLAALRGALPCLDDTYRWHRNGQSHASIVLTAHVALDNARAAIALAERAS
jgi:hypothetical protein